MRTLKIDYTKYLNLGAALLATAVNIFTTLTGYDFMLQASRKDLNLHSAYTAEEDKTKPSSNIYTWPNFTHSRNIA